MTYRFVEALTENQILDLMDLYRYEFWSKERTYQDVVKMLAATDLLIGLVDESDRLLGFTRVLTDFVYRATVYDVIVRSSHRGLGLGAQLMEALVTHPKLQTVEHIHLSCLPEMIPFYERWGFTANLGGIIYMRRSAQELA